MVGRTPAALGQQGSNAALHRSVLDVLEESARRAILPRYQRLAVEETELKSAGELVTVADRESENIISEGLARLLPEATIIGEEAASAEPALLDCLRKGLCWLIDPLDGTGNFVSGAGPFGMLVALADSGLVLGGWIYDPLSRRFISAYRSEGATVNFEPFTRPNQWAAPRTLGLSALLAEQRKADLISGLDGFFDPVGLPRCAADVYPQLMHGQLGLALFERTLPWDHAAGVLCLTEAGGMATRLDGTAYRVGDDRSGLLAGATPSLWAEGLERIASGQNAAGQRT